MTSDAKPSNDPALVWGEDGLPRSGRFGDVYFSSDDGLAESRAVFLTGCGLPKAWVGRDRFTVAETGFGTGLNIAALLDLWSREGPPGGRLQIFSIEAFPVTREDAARALGRWPEIADAAGLLLSRWPRRTPGFHRIDLPELRATLDLAVMEAGEALRQWEGRADAWFLDGFAPSTNPDMWRQEVLDRIAARSAPGARAATFTVAGVVRRGLQQAGFTVARQPGFGRKRERLEAGLPGGPADPSRAAAVAVIGAGIAGASLARAFRELGVEPVLFDPRGPGGGASGNPAALVTPRLDAGLGAQARLHAQALNRAVDLYGRHSDAIIASGALQLEADARDPGRFDIIAGSDLHEPAAMVRLTPAEASERLNEAAPGALAMAEAVVLAPDVLLDAWAGEVRRQAVAAITPLETGYRLLDEAGATLCVADLVVVAAGHASAAFAADLTLQPVRGQASWAIGLAPALAVSKGGYVIPTRDGLLFGATFDRDRTDDVALPGDDDRNRTLLAATLPGLALQLGDRPVGSRASIRAATRDRLPLAGRIPDAPGLLILSGLGSRGFCTAPLLAEHVAALALDRPSPLPTDLAAIVDPGRFRRRARRRSS